MIWIWLGFLLLILFLLALDLGVFHRKAHVVKVKEALAWSVVWAALGMTFGAFVYFGYERHWMGLGLLTPEQQARAAALPAGERSSVFVDKWAVSADNPHGLLDGAAALTKYVTGYLVEKSLAVDNIFVIALIFGYLAVPPIYQHRVLFWGILGALAMRGGMIAAGAELIERHQWIIYVFGAFLILTGVKMLLITENKNPADSWVVRTVKRIWPVTDKFHGEHFFVRAGTDASHEAATPGAAVERDEAVERMERVRKGALMMTPLFLALVLVEFTDLIFAVDSIPAIFAVTTDPFLVFTSNAFAILGLRSLYFALAGLMDKFHYLKVSLAVLLAVVGGKMMAHDWLKKALGEHVHVYLLGVTVAILAAGVVASVVWNRRRARGGEGGAGGTPAAVRERAEAAAGERAGTSDKRQQPAGEPVA
jgi:tellurite resistance protein TerC